MMNKTKRIFLLLVAMVTSFTHLHTSACAMMKGSRKDFVASKHAQRRSARQHHPSKAHVGVARNPRPSEHVSQEPGWWDRIWGRVRAWLGYQTEKIVDEKIVDFVYERDAQAVLKIIKDDWYWLFMPPYSFPESPEYILKHRSPGPEPENVAHRGKLKIKVLRENDEVAGFVTYYKENFDTGEVQLLAVAPKFRKRGYGRRLIGYAIKKLFSMGCKKVSLLTRKDDHKARRLYERIGFKEIGHYDHSSGRLIHYSLTRKGFKG